ncbi:hypothetical protein [Streptomyces yangpuensis]|uniref:hypothetical protein n=1 Tax=Streptomyces yangpuensis TaxID=1648182 RepID=UPI00365553BD
MLSARAEVLRPGSPAGWLPLHVALDAAAQAAGAAVEVLEAINVILPSGLVVPDIVVADAGATAEDGVSIDAEAVQLSSIEETAALARSALKCTNPSPARRKESASTNASLLTSTRVSTSLAQSIKEPPS